MRETFDIVQDEDGAVVRRQLVDRRGQRHTQFGLAGLVVQARRPVGDRRGVLAVLVEQREGLVERDVAASVSPAAELLVGSIGDDSVEPGAEGRLTPERVDFPHHRPERVLYHFLGVLRASRDAARQAVRAVAVRGDEMLRCGRLTAPQRLHELTVAIDPRGGSRLSAPLGPDARSRRMLSRTYEATSWIENRCNAHLHALPSRPRELLTR